MSDIDEDFDDFEEEDIEDEFMLSDGDKTLNERMSASGKSMKESFKKALMVPEQKQASHTSKNNGTPKVKMSASHKSVSFKAAQEDESASQSPPAKQHPYQMKTTSKVKAIYF